MKNYGEEATIHKLLSLGSVVTGGGRFAPVESIVISAASHIVGGEVGGM